MVDGVRDHDAHHKIDTHEKVCAERYGNLWSAVERIERTILAHYATSDTRLTAMSNRMWALVVGCGASAFLGLGGVAFYLLTRGKL